MLACKDWKDFQSCFFQNLHILLICGKHQCNSQSFCTILTPLDMWPSQNIAMSAFWKIWNLISTRVCIYHVFWSIDNESLWPGALFQNRSFWDGSAQFWETRKHRVVGTSWYCCVVHLQDKVTPSTKALWPGASFQNRSYWDRSSLFWIREDTSADDEGIVAWRVISKQILLIP
jgi:hypothetical protein